MAFSKRLDKISVSLANGFGLGLSPFASGTVGTLPALPLIVIFWGLLGIGWGWQLLLAVGLSLLAIPICSAGERHYGTKDDGRIVADEYMTFPICMIGLPFDGLVLLMAFLTCRFFDIAKPEPANRLQRLRGGTGIVMDDVIASLYSLALNHLLYWLILRGLLASA